MTSPTNPHGYSSRKLSVHYCLLNSAVTFFHGLEKCSPDKGLISMGHPPTHTAVLLQPSPPSYHRTATGEPSPARQFPDILHIGSFLSTFILSSPKSYFLKIPIGIKLLGFGPLFMTFFLYDECRHVKAAACHSFLIVHPSSVAVDSQLFSSGNCSLFSFVTPGTKGSGF